MAKMKTFSIAVAASWFSKTMVNFSEDKSISAEENFPMQFTIKVPIKSPKDFFGFKDCIEKAINKTFGCTPIFFTWRPLENISYNGKIFAYA